MKNRRQCVAYVFPLRGKREVAMFESNLLYMQLPLPERTENGDHILARMCQI